MTAPIAPRLQAPPVRRETATGMIVEFGPVRRDQMQAAPRFCGGHALLAAIAETAARVYEAPVDAVNVIGRMWFIQGKRFYSRPTKAQIEEQEQEVDEWNIPMKYE